MSEYKINQNYDKEIFQEIVEIEVPNEEYLKAFERALQAVKKSFSMPGFRKGKAPDKVVLESKEQEISMKALNICLNEILSKNPLDPRPYNTPNLLEFKTDENDPNKSIKVKLSYIPAPIFTSFDISKIKLSKTTPKEATAEDIENELKHIWLHYSKKADEAIKEEDYKSDKYNSEFFENKDFSHDYPQIKDIEGLKTLIKDFINRTYKEQAQIEDEKNLKREIANSAVVEKIEGFVEVQNQTKVENYLKKFKDLGLEPEKFLSEQKVNLDDLKKEWKEETMIDTKFELALSNYAKDKGFEAKEEEIDAEFTKLDPETKKHYNNDESLLRYIIGYQIKNVMAYKDIEKTLNKE